MFLALGKARSTVIDRDHRRRRTTTTARFTECSKCVRALVCVSVEFVGASACAVPFFVLTVEEKTRQDVGRNQER